MILVIFSLISSLIWNLNKVPSVVFSVKDEIMSGSIRYIPVSSFVYSLLRFPWKYCGNGSTTGKINLPKRVNPLSVEVSRKVRIIKNNWQVLRHRVLGAFRWDWCARRLVFVLGTLIQQTLYELFSAVSSGRNIPKELESEMWLVSLRSKIPGIFFKYT